MRKMGEVDLLSALLFNSTKVTTTHKSKLIYCYPLACEPKRVVPRAHTSAQMQFIAVERTNNWKVATAKI